MADRGPSERAKAAVEDLDEALAGDEPSDFAEEHPDAPEWAIETAEQVQETRERIRQKERELKADLETRVSSVEQRKRERKAKWEDLATDLETRIAVLATQAGVATEEEKQRVKEARRETNSEPGDMATIFDPASERGL